MDFKDRLRELRESRSLSPSHVAVQFGKSESAIRMWETGRSKPDADTLISLAVFFDVSTDYLLGRTNVRNPENAAAVDELGLSEQAINLIKKMKDKSFYPSEKAEKDIAYDEKKYVDIINDMLESHYFYALIDDIGCLADPSIDHWESTYMHIDEFRKGGKGRPAKEAYMNYAIIHLNELIEAVAAANSKNAGV